ncbi:MAG: trehalose-phosphatase [Actinomycetes bacterium]
MGVPEPATEAGRAGLGALRAEPGRALLAFDFDGTLAPIVPDPDQARAHPAVPALLARLGNLVGRIAIVTGRPARVAAERAGLSVVAGGVVLGHYGLERWAGGTVTAPEEAEGVTIARRRLPGLLAEVGAPQGTWLEDKGQAVAVHLRRTPDPQAALALVEGPVAGLARETGLALERGRMVLELRPPGADKGGAVRRLVAEDAPSMVAFVGDDLGDLAAFDEVDRLRGDGLPGLLVCSGSTEVSVLAGRADIVVDGPDGVVALLESLAEDLER